MGQSKFMVKKRNLPPLLSFSALLVCILPHCRLRDWCGNMRKASGHEFVASTNQRHSAFLIPHFTFRIPHSASPHFTHSPVFWLMGRLGLGARSWVRIGLGVRLGSVFSI